MQLPKPVTSSDMIGVLLTGCFAVVPLVSAQNVDWDQSSGDVAALRTKPTLEPRSSQQGRCKSLLGINDQATSRCRKRIACKVPLQTRCLCAVFPLFSVVRFANSECLSSAESRLNGTCFTRRECTNFGGTPSGPCANGLGTCCVCE